MQSKPGYPTGPLSRYPTDTFSGELFGVTLLTSFVAHIFLAKIGNIPHISNTPYEEIAFATQLFFMFKMLNCMLLLIYVIFCAQCTYENRPPCKNRKMRYSFCKKVFGFDLFLCFLLFIAQSPSRSSDCLRLLSFYILGIISHFFCGNYMINAVRRFRFYQIFLHNFKSLQPILRKQIRKEEAIVLTVTAVFLIVTLSCILKS
jgi:hypothetical protein